MKIPNLPKQKKSTNTVTKNIMKNVHFQLLSPAEDSPKKEMEYHTKYEEQLKDEEKSKKVSS